VLGSVASVFNWRLYAVGPIPWEDLRLYLVGDLRAGVALDEVAVSGGSRPCCPCTLECKRTGVACQLSSIFATVAKNGHGSPGELILRNAVAVEGPLRC
jgi:hypothetical protein